MATCLRRSNAFVTMGHKSREVVRQEQCRPRPSSAVGPARETSEGIGAQLYSSPDPVSKAADNLFVRRRQHGSDQDCEAQSSPNISMARSHPQPGPRAAASAPARGAAPDANPEDAPQATPPSGAPGAPVSGARKRSQQALDDYLSALFPMRVEEPEAAVGPAVALAPGAREHVRDEDTLWIERERIEPNPAQPRRTWSSESLRDLGQSLLRDGQLQACVVRPHPSKDGFYQLVSGERRWRASGPEFADLERLRCTIRAVGDDDSMRLALVENLQREDLNDIDKARAFVDLRRSLRQSDPQVTWSQIGQAVGLSREYLQRLKALLDLPPEVQEMVRGGVLSGRSARVLTSLKDSALQLRLAHEIQRDKLSSDQAQERARLLASPTSPPKKHEPSTTQPVVTRESQERTASEGGGWEEALRQAVALLAQAREAQARGGKASKKGRKLAALARQHIEAIEATEANAAVGDS